MGTCTLPNKTSNSAGEKMGNINHPPSKPDWNVRYYKSFEAVDIPTWRLQVDGMVDNPGAFSLQDICSWPSITQVSRMVCVEGWSSKAEWTGFTYAALAAVVQPQADARWLHFYCADDYYEYLPIAETDIPRVLFAYKMDGALLQPLFGSPLRAIYPSKYGYKGAKAIMRIQFEAEGGKGYWPTVGPYSVDGTIEPGYDHPLDMGGLRIRRGGEIVEY